MAYTFADYPELAFAFPFLNCSFERWDGTLPEEWTQAATPAGTRTKYNPGFDSTRGLLISNPGTAGSNYIRQSITLPSFILNGQKIRAGCARKNSLGGAYGNALAVICVFQNSYGYSLLGAPYGTSSASWGLDRFESTSDINASYTDIALLAEIYSRSGAADPAAAFDCLFAEYGRSITERYYTFTRKPEFSGLDVFASTFVQTERTGVAKRRTWDSTGGAVKWTVVMPFVNIPGAMVEALRDFWNRNKGLEDKAGVHLVLHHKLVDTTDAYNLHIPPWIICDIAEPAWPFKYSGSFLGAKLFSGTLTFEEV